MVLPTNIILIIALFTATNTATPVVTAPKIDVSVTSNSVQGFNNNVGTSTSNSLSAKNTQSATSGITVIAASKNDQIGATNGSKANKNTLNTNVNVSNSGGNSVKNTPGSSTLAGSANVVTTSSGSSNNQVQHSNANTVIRDSTQVKDDSTLVNTIGVSKVVSVNNNGNASKNNISDNINVYQAGQNDIKSSAPKSAPKRSSVLGAGLVPTTVDGSSNQVNSNNNNNLDASKIQAQKSDVGVGVISSSTGIGASDGGIAKSNNIGSSFNVGSAVKNSITGK